MFTVHRGQLLVWCFLLSMAADGALSISGKVKDGAGAAITGAKVALASDTTQRAITTANGEFIISNNTSINGNAAFSLSAPATDNICIKRSRLRISVASPADNGSVAIFSTDGKMWYTFPLGRMGSGIHEYSLPEITAGFYVMSIVIDRRTTTWKLVATGNKSFLGDNGFGSAGVLQLHPRAAVPVKSADTLLVTKDGFKPLKEMIVSYQQTGIAIIMDRTKSPSITVSTLPAIKEMPDPMVMNDGTNVTTPEQWKIRRREMIRILEDYEYGHMPPPPGNVKATVTTPLTRVTAGGKQADYRTLHLTFGPNDKCGFDMGIFTPTDSGKRYPILIYLGYSSPTKTSLGDASAAFSRGYAVAIINYTQLGADNTNYRTTGFFPSYPEYDWRDFSAWAWGLSRAVDYLVTDPMIDKEKIMATGVSRCGQPVLLAGAFDERIALSAPVAGGMALRFSGKEMGGGRGQGITEVVDQGTYWFGPLFEKFRNQTPRLPCDQHWLPALTAPRLFIMCNSFADEYGRAYAAVQTYLGAKPVYTFFNADENLGLNFRAGGHGMQAEDWAALLDFADQKLLKKAGTRKFDVIPPADKTP